MQYKRSVVALSVLGMVLGCAAADNNGSGYVPPARDASTDVGVQDGAVKDNWVPTDSPIFDVTIPDLGPEKPAIIYAHDKDTLYSAQTDDPNMKFTAIGVFDCIGEGTGQASSMTDIAVDKDGKLYGISTKAVFLDMQLSQSIVKCSSQKVDIVSSSSETRFFGLTFAPRGVFGTEEVLVAGNTIGDLYTISLKSGDLTKVGRFGTVPNDDGQGHDYEHSGKNWSLSGDIVFLENNGSPLGFATVRDCPDPSQAPKDCSLVDTLVEIDVNALGNTGGSAPMVTKRVLGKILPTGCDVESCGFGSLYGIGAFDSKVYGFSSNGKVIEVNNANGTGKVIGTYADAFFAGAGVSTSTRVIAPPPK